MLKSQIQICKIYKDVFAAQCRALLDEPGARSEAQGIYFFIIFFIFLHRKYYFSFVWLSKKSVGQSLVINNCFCYRKRSSTCSSRRILTRAESVSIGSRFPRKVPNWWIIIIARDRSGRAYQASITHLGLYNDSYRSWVWGVRTSASTQSRSGLVISKELAEKNHSSLRLQDERSLDVGSLTFTEIGLSDSFSCRSVTQWALILLVNNEILFRFLHCTGRSSARVSHRFRHCFSKVKMEIFQQISSNSAYVFDQFRAVYWLRRSHHYQSERIFGGSAAHLPLFQAFSLDSRGWTLGIGNFSLRWPLRRYRETNRNLKRIQCVK